MDLVLRSAESSGYTSLNYTLVQQVLESVGKDFTQTSPRWQRGITGLRFAVVYA